MPGLGILVTAAVVGALMVFGLVILAGSALVRWLGLFSDTPDYLPEGVRFSPLPPDSWDGRDPERARAIAGRQAQWARACATARDLAGQSSGIAGLAAACQDLDDARFVQAGIADPAAVRTRLADIHQRLEIFAREAETGMRHVDPEQAVAVTGSLAQAARILVDEANALVAPLPEASSRRLWLLLAGLILALVLLAAVLTLRPMP